jgi:quercetin dioxygenase-like cupin family protein
MNEPAPRLREHPDSRFAGEQHVFDLSQVAARLREEEHPATRGHRQETVFRHGAVTLALFVFEAGGELPEHQADGLVTIHVLDGALAVGTEERVYELSADQVLALRPGVRHSVRAQQASRMLLTVHREGA